MGKVAMWHTVKNKSGHNVDGDKRWELFPPSIINEPVLQLQVTQYQTQVIDMDCINIKRKQEKKAPEKKTLMKPDVR